MSRGALLVVLYLISASSAIKPGFDYGSTKVRGVNLGGWLVLEPWITPSIFENTGDSRIIDEYTFGQYKDHAIALKILQAHWDSWITEKDFEDIEKAGLNHVRLPIGYWAFDVSGGEPYVQGQLPYLKKAVSWAEKYGLKVIINLHGAPGSQNGFDNSGQNTSSPSWHLSRSNVDRTVTIIQQLAITYANKSSVVTAISALNEPRGDVLGEPMVNTLEQYWYDCYGNIRYPYYGSKASLESNTILIISDAFLGLDKWTGFMPPPDFQGVIMDIHKYQVFNYNELKRTMAGHISAVCSEGRELGRFSASSTGLWTIVGEWTVAGTDCAKYLNSRGVGSRYDGTYPGSKSIHSCAGLTGRASSFSSDYQIFLRQYWEAQTISYEQGLGWIQWTWKTESADEWSYKAGLDYGWIPRIPTDRKYPDICR